MNESIDSNIIYQIYPCQCDNCRTKTKCRRKKEHNSEYFTKKSKSTMTMKLVILPCVKNAFDLNTKNNESNVQDSINELNSYVGIIKQRINDLSTLPQQIIEFKNEARRALDMVKSTNNMLVNLLGEARVQHSQSANIFEKMYTKPQPFLLYELCNAEPRNNVRVVEVTNSETCTNDIIELNETLSTKSTDAIKEVSSEDIKVVDKIEEFPSESKLNISLSLDDHIKPATSIEDDVEKQNSLAEPTNNVRIVEVLNNETCTNNIIELNETAGPRNNVRVVEILNNETCTKNIIELNETVSNETMSKSHEIINGSGSIDENMEEERVASLQKIAIAECNEATTMEYDVVENILSSEIDVENKESSSDEYITETIFEVEEMCDIGIYNSELKEFKSVIPQKVIRDYCLLNPNRGFTNENVKTMQVDEDPISIMKASIANEMEILMNSKSGKMTVQTSKDSIVITKTSKVDRGKYRCEKCCERMTPKVQSQQLSLWKRMQGITPRYEDDDAEEEIIDRSFKEEVDLVIANYKSKFAQNHPKIAAWNEKRRKKNAVKKKLNKIKQAEIRRRKREGTYTTPWQDFKGKAKAKYIHLKSGGCFKKKDKKDDTEPEESEEELRKQLEEFRRTGKRPPPKVKKEAAGAAGAAGASAGFGGSDGTKGSPFSPVGARFTPARKNIHGGQPSATPKTGKSKKVDSSKGDEKGDGKSEDKKKSKVMVGLPGMAGMGMPGMGMPGMGMPGMGMPGMMGMGGMPGMTGMAGMPGMGGSMYGGYGGMGGKNLMGGGGIPGSSAFSKPSYGSLFGIGGPGMMPGMGRMGGMGSIGSGMAGMSGKNAMGGGLPGRMGQAGCGPGGFPLGVCKCKVPEEDPVADVPKTKGVPNQARAAPRRARGNDKKEDEEEEVPELVIKDPYAYSVNEPDPFEALLDDDEKAMLASAGCKTSCSKSDTRAYRLESNTDVTIRINRGAEENTKILGGPKMGLEIIRGGSMLTEMPKTILSTEKGFNKVFYTMQSTKPRITKKNETNRAKATTILAKQKSVFQKSQNLNDQNVHLVQIESAKPDKFSKRQDKSKTPCTKPVSPTQSYVVKRGKTKYTSTSKTRTKAPHKKMMAVQLMYDDVGPFPPVMRQNFDNLGFRHALDEFDGDNKLCETKTQTSITSEFKAIEFFSSKYTGVTPYRSFDSTRTDAAVGSALVTVVNRICGDALLVDRGCTPIESKNYINQYYNPVHDSVTTSQTVGRDTGMVDVGLSCIKFSLTNKSTCAATSMTKDQFGNLTTNFKSLEQKYSKTLQQWINPEVNDLLDSVTGTETADEDLFGSVGQDSKTVMVTFIKPRCVCDKEKGFIPPEPNTLYPPATRKTKEKISLFEKWKREKELNASTDCKCETRNKVKPFRKLKPGEMYCKRCNRIKTMQRTTAQVDIMVKTPRGIFQRSAKHKMNMSSTRNRPELSEYPLECPYPPPRLGPKGTLLPPLSIDQGLPPVNMNLHLSNNTENYKGQKHESECFLQITTCDCLPAKNPPKKTRLKKNETICEGCNRIKIVKKFVDPKDEEFQKVLREAQDKYFCRCEGDEDEADAADPRRGGYRQKKPNEQICPICQRIKVVKTIQQRVHHASILPDRFNPQQVAIKKNQLEAENLSRKESQVSLPQVISFYEDGNKQLLCKCGPFYAAPIYTSSGEVIDFTYNRDICEAELHNIEYRSNSALCQTESATLKKNPYQIEKSSASDGNIPYFNTEYVDFNEIKVLRRSEDFKEKRPTVDRPSRARRSIRTSRNKRFARKVFNALFSSPTDSRDLLFETSTLYAREKKPFFGKFK